MIDHYYGAFAGIAKEGTERLRAFSAQDSGRALEGAEHAAAVESLRSSASNSKRHGGVVVTIAPPEPPPEPKPSVLNFKPQPGVMVRQDIPSIAANPDLELRRTMVEAKVNDQPTNSPNVLESLLELGTKRDINLSQSLALLGAYNGDVESLTLRSRVEMGDVHGMQLLGEQVYNNNFNPWRYHHTPEVSFSVQTVDGGTIDIQLSIEEFINESGGYSGNMDPLKGMSRTLTFSMEAQGAISQAAWEGLAPIMESLDSMINTFNTDQALQQSDVDAFASQMTERQDVFSSGQLNLNIERSEAMYRKIQINSGAGNTTVSTDEKAMENFYRASVAQGRLTMMRVNDDFDLEASNKLIEDKSQSFYLSAITNDWDTDYDNLIRFMHSFLEE